MWTRNDIVVPMMAVWSKRKTLDTTGDFLKTLKAYSSWYNDGWSLRVMVKRVHSWWKTLQNVFWSFKSSTWLSTIISFIWVLLLKTTKMIFYFIFMLKTISHFSQSKKVNNWLSDCSSSSKTYFLFNYFVPFKKKRLKCNEHLKSGVVSPKGWGGGGVMISQFLTRQKKRATPPTIIRK